MFRFGLKAKLFLVTLSLAAIPLVGIGYVREMETLLVAQQEQNLLAAARAIRISTLCPACASARTITSPRTCRCRT